MNASRLLALLLLLATITFALKAADQEAGTRGPIHILFLGHDSKHHNSNAYFPMIAEALGREAIYFDYHTSVEEALGDFAYLSRFDGLVLYANHNKIAPHQFANLQRFVEDGGGFIPVHCASACFKNEPRFVQLVGGRFDHHQGKEFTATILKPAHPAMQGVREFHAWDETYVHAEQSDDRTILMTRKPEGTDNVTEPEPWTWTREQGKGRVFYTASGHDQRVWEHPEFHQLLKSGILWAVGDARRASYERFLSSRTPLRYEKRNNIPNYEKRPEPLPYQLPLSPEDSLSYTQVPVGWKLELFAAEPDIINPIYMQWDAQGRLWALETVDYPNEVRRGEQGDDSLKILEDTNGDGKCDKVTVFATGLNIPTSFTFAMGGVLLHQAPHTLFLQDTDGDDVADVKKIILDGWGINDTHAGPSNLRYGLDNQIWGTVGYAAFNGTVSGKTHKFGMGVYRFAKDGSSLEFLHQFNNNTWGVGFNAEGDVFGSTANNNPSFFGGIPATAYPTGRGMTARMIASTPAFQPITPNVRQVDAFGRYTAAAGHAFANSDGFPKSWRGRMAFVAGPTGNLLGKFMSSPDGAGFSAKNQHSLVASADEWFSPIVAEVGPDGHLWIADWYNFMIQHNPTPNPDRGGYAAKTGKGNAHVNPNRDREHGRIYRLMWDGAAKAEITSLKDATSDQLVAALADPNQFWRLTAQRLLVDGNHLEAEPALRRLLNEPGYAALHAFWTLHGLGLVDPATHRSALLSGDPSLRRNALRALPRNSQGADLLFETGVVVDPDKTTRLAALVALAHIPTTEAVRSAVSGLMQDPVNQEDSWLHAALQAAAATHEVAAHQFSGEVELGPDLLAKANWTERHYSGESTKQSLKNGGPDGSPRLVISSTKGADTSYHSFVNVKPNTRYRLEGFIRTKGLGGAMGALFNVHELQREDHATTNALHGNNPWTRVTTDFNSQQHARISINALLGGWGKSTGRASYAKISLRQITPILIEKNATGVSPTDANRGKTIFFTHQVAACNRCHQLGGHGGVIGPALDGIASRKDADYLRQSMVEPNAAIAESYPGPVSPMPPMNLLLNPQEIEDVLAYLETLK